MKNMEKKQYENIMEFCEDLVDTYECLDNEDNMGVSVLAKYEEAKEIISCLCMFDYDINFIEIESPDWDGYDDEYIISLVDDLIFCEKNKRDGKYLYSESDYVFVFDDCNSKCLNYVYSDKVYEVSIFDEEDFELEDEFEDDCDCDVSVDSDGDMHGFTLQKSSEDGYSSISFYSTEKLCACELEHLMDIFRI